MFGSACWPDLWKSSIKFCKENNFKNLRAKNKINQISHLQVTFILKILPMFWLVKVIGQATILLTSGTSLTWVEALTMWLNMETGSLMTKLQELWSSREVCFKSFSKFWDCILDLICSNHLNPNHWAQYSCCCYVKTSYVLIRLDFLDWFNFSSLSRLNNTMSSLGR